MRDSSRLLRACRPHLAIATVLLLASPAPRAHAQVAFSAGYTRQHVDAGLRSEGLSGYSGEAAIRVGRRVNLTLGGEQLGHDASATRGVFKFSAFRVGVQLLAAHSRSADLSFGTGLGVFSFDQDDEDDGGGISGFLQAQLAIYPIPVVGVYVGGIAQALDGVGRVRGGSSLGLNLGIQLRSDGW